MFVSPLRRTIETAYHIFKDHPDFANLKVILHPILREKICVSGDVPLSNEDFSQQLKDVYQPLFGNRIDTHLMDMLV